MKGWVYIAVLPSTPDRLKIGFTHNFDPEDRLRELSKDTGAPDHLSLVYSAAFNNPQKVEELVHQSLKEFRVKGEWFAVDSETAIQTIQSSGHEILTEDRRPPRDTSSDFYYRRNIARERTPDVPEVRGSTIGRIYDFLFDNEERKGRIAHSEIREREKEQAKRQKELAQSLALSTVNPVEIQPKKYETESGDEVKERVVCPYCGAKLLVNTGYRGKVICKKCFEHLDVVN